MAHLAQHQQRPALQARDCMHTAPLQAAQYPRQYPCGTRTPVSACAARNTAPFRQFEVSGLDRKCWSNATPIRTIFREAFVRAGLPYFNQHCLRNTLVRLGQDVCKTPEQFKAWSQNLGHEKVLTTFLSYGEVECQRQGEIIRDLATPQQAAQPDADEIAEAVFNKFRSSGVDIQTR